MAKKYIVTVNGTSYEVVVEDADPNATYTVCFGICERGNHLPHFVSFAGSRTNQMPIGSGCGKWRLKKVLFFNG